MLIKILDCLTRRLSQIQSKSEHFKWLWGCCRDWWV